jgi:hypothetical protein
MPRFMLSMSALLCLLGTTGVLGNPQSSDETGAADAVVDSAPEEMTAETEGPGDETAAQAKALFDVGTRLYEAGEYGKAADAFREADALKPNWKLHFNIGQCESLAKRHGLALQAFAAYLSKGGDDIPLARQAEVREEILRLKEMTGYLEVSAPEGAEILVNDVKRGTSPLAGYIPVSAGVTHRVTISLRKADGGARTQTRDVVVVSGKTVHMNFMPGEAGPPDVRGVSAPVVPRSEIAPHPVASPISPLRKVGLVTLVTGGFLLVSGSITGIVAGQKYGELEDNCPDTTCTGTGDQNLIDDIDTLNFTTDILLPAGGALAITGIILLTVDHRRQSKREQARVQVQPLATGVLLQGRF